MPRTSDIQTNFTSGEISPRLDARVDLAKYNNGASILENFLPFVHGGLRRRDGTIYSNEVKTSSKATRLIPFIVSVDANYMLELGDQYIRFYENGEVLAGPLEVSAPWLEADIDLVKVVQSADTMYMFHPDYQTRKLIRTAATPTFSLTAVDFEEGPFLDQNTDTTLTITASAVTGTGITLTASSALFSSDHVGALFKISVEDFTIAKPWEGNKSYTSGDLVENGGRYYTAGSTATSGVIAPVHDEGVFSDGTIEWTYVNPGFGIVEIKTFSSSTSVTADVLLELPADATSGTSKWSEGAWSAAQRYPQCGTFFNQRLAASDLQTFNLSQSGLFENFAPVDRDANVNATSAARFTVDDVQVNFIQWMVTVGKKLALLTKGGEFIVGPETTGQPFAPDNVDVDRQSAYGVNQFVRPLPVGKAILFVDKGGQRLREFVFSFEVDGFVAPDLTVLSEHLTTPEKIITYAAYQSDPDSVYWAVRSDGVLLSMTYDREQDVVGWARHLLGGSFGTLNYGVVEAVATLPKSDDTGQEVWLIVKRTINGSTKRYVEYMDLPFSEDDDLVDALFLDSSITYDSTETSTITGLDHLEGETVGVFADGAQQTDKVVSSGSITLDTAASKVHVGLKYNSRMQSVRPEPAVNTLGTAQGKLKRIHEVVLRLDRSLGGSFGPSFDELEEIVYRQAEDPLDSPPPLFTEDQKLEFDGEWELDGRMCILVDQPLPFTILGLITEMSVNA